MSGKSYAYMQLGLSFLQDTRYKYSSKVVELVMTQLSLKAALKQWGKDAKAAVEAEAKQLHWRNSFRPVHWKDVNKDVAIVDIPNAFIQTVMENNEGKVGMRIRGHMVDVLVKVAPSVYGSYVSTGKQGKKQLLVKCLNAIYGTMVASLLYYRKFTRSLKNQGYVMNPYDPCVWNKMIKKK